MGIDSAITVRLRVNGRLKRVEVNYTETLLSVIRNRLLLTGTKYACLQGECGACAVRVNGVLVHSCLYLACQADGASIETVEAVEASALGRRLQDSFLAHGACQCGYCTPGFLVAATDLLSGSAAADSATIQNALEGNLCRCTGYTAIRRAVESVAESRKGTA